MITHILNHGMGVESTACLVRWILDPSSRPFAHLSQLVVLIAQTGDEFHSTKWLTETFLFPLLRKHNVRVIQVATSGFKRKDGWTVLSDTRQPRTLHIEGDSTLGEYLIANGTTVRFGSPHTCAIKRKGWPLDNAIDMLERQAINRQAATYFKLSMMLAEQVKDTPLLTPSSLEGFYRINSDRLLPIALLYSPCQFLIGPHICYSVGEEKRKAKSDEYGCRGHMYIYPVIDQFRWTREDCWNYLKQVFNVSWEKSCCQFCPFITQVAAFLRYTAEPYGLAYTMFIEANCMHFNPRMHHFGHGTAFMVAHRMRDGDLPRGMKTELKRMGESEVEFTARMQAAGQEAIALFERMWYEQEEWAVYHVRRIKWPKPEGSKLQYDPSDRCVQIVGTTGTREQMLAKLDSIEEENDGWRITQTMTEFTDGMRKRCSAKSLYRFTTMPIDRVFVWSQREHYPMVEEFYMVSPAIVREKVSNAAQFEADWDTITTNLTRQSANYLVSNPERTGTLEPELSAGYGL